AAHASLLFDDRVADVRHGHAMFAVEIGLEGKEHDHVIDGLGNLPHASLPPGPDLRRDVVDDTDAELFASFRHAHVEAGIVHEEHCIGAFARDAGHEIAHDADEHRQMAKHV